MDLHWRFLVILSATFFFCCNASLEDNNNIRRLPGDIKPTSYGIRIHPYFDAQGVIFEPEKNQTFDGAVFINATVIKPTSTILLNAMNLTFPASNYSVFSFTNNEFIATINFLLTPENQTLTIELERELQNGDEIEIGLSYSGKIVYHNDFGLFKSTRGDGDVYLTQFATTGARYVFPSFDEPDYKATFEIAIVKPKVWVAISNTLNISTTDIGNGYEEVYFEKSIIMSSYLVAFAIGDLIKAEGYTADGILTRVWSFRSFDSRLNIALKSAIKCTDTMTKYTSFKLPLKKIDHLAIPVFIGAMENFGLIVYDENDLLFYPYGANKFKRFIDTTSTICHEVSHHWFGDIVTNKWWGDLVIQEGMANFFQFKAMQLAYPKERAYLDTIIARQKSIELLFNDENTDNLHPIITQNGTFDDITYDMGGAIIRQLEAVITPKVFQKGLQNYIQKYQYSNANYQQLLDEIQLPVEDTNLRDWCGELFNVTKFMGLWLNQKGHPNLHIDFSDGIFSVTQNVQNGTDEKFWPLPVFIQLENNRQRLYWSARKAFVGNLENYSTPFLANYICENGNKLPRVLKIKTSALFVNRDILGVTDVSYSSNAIDVIVDALTTFSTNFQLSPASLLAFIFDVYSSAVKNGAPKEHLQNIIENIFMHQRNVFSLGVFNEFTEKIQAWLNEGKFDNVFGK